MSEETPSNAVLLAKLEALSDVVLANHVDNNAQHEKILDQTTKTNGRVGRLESWRSFLLGAWAMIVIGWTIFEKFIK